MFGVAGRGAVLTVPPTVRSTGTVTYGSDGSIVLPVPSYQAGDLMIAVFGTQYSGSGAFVNASWTTAYARGSTGDTTIQYRTATASEPASYTWTNSNNNAYIGAIFIVRDGVWAQVGTAAVDTDPLVAPSITIADNNSLLFALYSGDITGTATTWTTPPTGMTLVLGDADTTRLSVGVYSQSVNAGATGTRSKTIGDGSTSRRAGILFAVKPVA